MVGKTRIVVEGKAHAERLATEMLQASYIGRVSDVSKSIEEAEEALTLAKEVAKSKKLEHQAYAHLGLYFMIVGRNEESIDYSHKALKYFNRVLDKAKAADALYTIGSVYYKTAAYDKGLDYLYKCLRINKELGDLQAESRTLKAIGYIYETFSDYKAASKAYERCMMISREQGDKNGEANACNPLSGLYLNENDFDTAFEIINRSLALSLETGDRRSHAFALYGKAKIYHKLRRQDEALKYYNQSLEIHREVGECLGRAMTLTKLGILYFQLGEVDKAKKSQFEALEVGTIMSNKKIVFKAYHALYEIARKQDNVKEALVYHENYHRLKEEIMDIETSGKIKSQRVIYKAESLENEARIQRQKNAIIEKKNIELDRLNKELTIANSTKDKFFSIISHDLQSPLNSLVGLSRIFDQDYHNLSDTEKKSYINTISEISDNMLRLTRNLLDWARFKGDETEVSPTQFNIHELFKKNIQLLSVHAAKKNIDIKLHIDPTTTIDADFTMIDVVARNLLANAIKFTPMGGVISVCSKSHKKSIELSVIDTGVGIRENDMDKLFKAHEKLQTRGTLNEKGTGLGLSLCKEFVEKHGGRIWATSKLNEGSTFTVRLPQIHLPNNA
ncbi:MAG: tetratricopeptide repeat-containing sensor histidine kinase [Bacteroidota bacterium]